MNRLMILAAMAAMLTLVAGCPDSAPPLPISDTPDGSIDTSGDAEVAEPDLVDTLEEFIGDVPDVPDVPDEVEPDADAPPPPPAELSFCVNTPVAGCVGSDDDQLDLVKNDETSDDLYPETPELEVDVQVTALNVPAGTTISLTIDGNTVADQVLPGESLNFAMVQLTHALAPDCHVVEVAAEDLITVSKTICVDTGACGVTLAPSNQDCLTEDDDPDMEGFQATFIVTNGGTDCDAAWLEIDGVQSDPVTLDAGEAEIQITLAESADALDCDTVEVTAWVTAADDATRTVSVTLDYILDTVPPTLQLTAPAPGTVNLGDDLDGNAANGIQLILDGVATGLGPDDEISVTIDGEEVGVTAALGGVFTLDPITLGSDGLHVIAVTAADACCGQVATASVEVVSLLAPSNVMILAPLSGSKLLAANDMAPGTLSAMDTSFLVYAPLAEVGTTLQVQCRKDQSGSLWRNAGNLTVAGVAPDGQYGVDVLIDVELVGNQVICRARDNSAPPVVSPEISLTIGLPAPLLILTSPEDGEVVAAEAFSVVGVTLFLSGQPVGLSLSKDGAEAWSSEVVASTLGFSVQEDLSGLAEGVYTLAATASDAFGNDAGATPGSLAEIAIELDSQAPGAFVLSPQNGQVCDPVSCPDVNPAGLGHQISVNVLVTGEAHPELTEVCLAFNGQAAPCLYPDLDTGEVVFDNLTIVPGVNTVDLTATDAAGHVNVPAQTLFTFDISAPKVVFTTPANNVVVASQPVPVSLYVTSADGATPLEDATVALFVDGAEFGNLTAGAGGAYDFSLSGLTLGVPVEIQASAVHPSEAEVGYSSPRSVLLKDGTPEITITAPGDGAILNVASSICAAGIPGCTLKVTAATTNAENGSTATLTVDCGTPIVIPGVVSGNSVSWSGVNLADNSVCTLEASVNDLAGQAAEAVPVTVTVDRTAPVLSGFVQPDFELMPAGLDEDPAEAGYQYTIIVGLKGLEAGQSVDLQLTPEVGPPEVTSVVLDAAIPDTAFDEVVFPQMTFEGGIYQLLVSVTDAAGNTDSESFAVQFYLETTQVSLVGSDYIPFDLCESDDDCSGTGVCQPVDGAKKCLFPWNAGAHKIDAKTQPADFFSTTSSPLRICSAHTGLVAAGAALCETTDGPVKFRVVKSVNHGGGSQFVQLTAAEVGALPQGYHRMVAEALADSGTWVLSGNTPNYTQQERYYWLDVDPPAISGVTFPSDTLPPVGTLNIAESEGQGSTFQANVTFAGDESGSLEVWDNGILIADTAVNGDSVTLSLALYEGLNMLQFIVIDQVGNVSSPFELDLSVDTSVPVLSFTAPAASPLVSGSSADTSLVASGTDGNDVHLERNLGGTWVELVAGPVDAQGLVTFADVLALDGTYQLRGWVRDDANNEAMTTTSPEFILVDRTPPVATLDQPATASTFTDDDDAAPATPGFQFQTLFDVAGAASWSISLAACPDATFTGCDAGVVAATATLPDESLATIDQLITVGAVDQETEYRQVQVEVTDGVGNSVVLTADLTLNFTACVVAFSDAPETGWYNTSYCDPAGADCASISTTLTANFTTGCGAVDQVRLYQDGGAVTTLAAAGSAVAFPVSLDDGDSVTFEARLLIGGAETGDTSGDWSYGVDLTNPVVAFTDPAPGTTMLGQADDLNPGADGCQITAAVDVTGDNLAGGTVALSTAAGGPETILGDTTMTGAPFSYTWPSAVNLDEASARTLTATAIDEAGNSGTATLTLNVDVTPPAAVDLKTINAATDVNPRRPAVTLSWEAVGDDGATGDPATAYEVRYSTAPITAANFDAACDLSGLSQTLEPPAPGAPGALETFLVTGPDDRAPADPCRFVTATSPTAMYYFGVKASDEVGNTSLFATDNAESTGALRLQYTQVLRGTYTDGNMDAHPVRAGDVNDDGREDLLLGAYGENGFCLMLGRADPPATIDLSQDAQTQCLFDSVQSQAGLDLAGVGDVNGDGYDDIAMVSYKDADGTARTRVRVYLGSDTGVLSTTPDVSFVFGTTGLFWVNFVPIAGAGNFNGDMNGELPIDDIVVATPQNNTVYVIPGNVNWGLAPLEIDLEDPADQAASMVVEITRTSGGASNWFGMSVGAGGNVLPDAGETQYDDLVISQYGGPSAAYVIPGRALSGSAALTISPELDGAGSEDAVSVRLRPQGNDQNKDWFFGQILGGEDLDCDGIPELIGVHLQAALSDGRSIYVFNGDFVAGGVGTTLYIGIIEPAGSAFVSPNGTIIKGNYQSIGLLGNFDDSQVQPECSGDLVYGDFNGLSFFGSVYVRHNLPGVYGMASFQEVDQTIQDPFTPGNLDFGGIRIAPLSDFDGDGYPDMMVGTNGSGYMTLIR
jgi:hypothetical protein